MAFPASNVYRLWGLGRSGRAFLMQQPILAAPFQLRTISILAGVQGPPLGAGFSVRPASLCQSDPGRVSPWSHQQIRTKARGNEYQPSNIKRKRTHGWCKHIKTRSGIELILRRILKGRKSLTH
uniref:Large ribosomal subunit protein bL34m n=1 Tax=Sphenodon punctatus TaxID=8508 RepID=A0A8D0GN08_SPHPU